MLRVSSTESDVWLLGETFHRDCYEVGWCMSLSLVENAEVQVSSVAHESPPGTPILFLSWW